ncbi:hypothetical protein CPB85DRAFT_903156 [Mucidula mucida]|nr:hypothetical protein CPB85DRAFT_402966 [Mucidula mucida]KAF8905893.1 hypothetical protein CPB85DRAFT_903156 [Mucidula mucida]
MGSRPFGRVRGYHPSSASRDCAPTSLSSPQLSSLDVSRIGSGMGASYKEAGGRLSETQHHISIISAITNLTSIMYYTLVASRNTFAVWVSIQTALATFVVVRNNF